MDYSSMTESELIELYETGRLRDRDYVKLIESGKISLRTILNNIDSSDYGRYSREKREIYTAIARRASDEEKMRILARVEGSYVRDFLIMSLKNEEMIIEAVSKYVKHNYSRSSILMEIEFDNVKIQLLPTIDDEEIRVEVITTLSDDELKASCIEDLSIPNCKAEVIASMDNSSDGRKLELLPDGIDEENKLQVYLSLKNDISKDLMVDDLNIEANKVQLIRSFKSDDPKVDYVDQMESDWGKAGIIATIESDETKLKLLEEINDEAAKILIILSLSSMTKSKKLLKEMGIEFEGKYKEFGLDENTTIGMEIESEGEYSYFLENLKNIFYWELKEDGSLENGVECTSPVMFKDSHSVDAVYGICSILQKLGQKVSSRCGGHIHIGAHTLESAEAYKNLMEMWCNVELPLYLISNEEGILPREGIDTYADPIKPKVLYALNKGSINIKDTDDLDKLVEDFQEIQEGRYSGLNFLNVDYYNSRNTIEFRTPNGSLNPDVWIENARLFGRLVETAEKLAEIELKDEEERTEDENVKLYFQEALREDLSDEEKLEILLDLLFEEEEKEAYLRRYEVNSKLYEQLPAYKKFFRKKKETVNLGGPKKKNNKKLEDNDDEMTYDRFSVFMISVLCFSLFSTQNNVSFLSTVIW